MRGPVVFVGLAVALTWLAAAWCEAAVAGAGAGEGAPLLRASLIYVAVVGWQPLVALAVARRWFGDDGELDHGVRGGRGRFWWMSVAWPVALLIAAVGVRLVVAGDLGHGLDAGAGAEGAPARPWTELPSAIGAFLGAAGVLWLQAVGEELSWRGYLLTRLMRGLGAWPGLVLHGVLWGIGYAPIFLVGAGAGSLERLAGFVVTCALLGIVFGWIRLASRSIYVSAASNAMLTIAGGLPLALQGTAPPLAAIYEPAGWLPIAAAIALIASRSSLRAAVAVPYRALPDHVS